MRPCPHVIKKSKLTLHLPVVCHRVPNANFACLAQSYQLTTNEEQLIDWYRQRKHT